MANHEVTSGPLSTFFTTFTIRGRAPVCPTAICSALRWTAFAACFAAFIVSSHLTKAGPFERPSAKATQAEHYRRQWAVIIGIDDYSAAKGLGNLQNAVNDAREFQQVLVEEFGFQNSDIAYLTTQEGPVGRQQIRSALAGLKPQLNDAVVFFFAGHGFRDGHLAVSDSDASNRAGTCLPLAELKQALNRLACRHKLVILDSCFSGALFDQQLSLASGASLSPSPAGPSRAGADFVDPPQAERDLGKTDQLRRHNLARKAFVGISAGTDTPVADGSGENRHSIFTSELLRALRERAGSVRSDQSFYFTELAALVRGRVGDALQSRQVPQPGTLGESGGDFVFRPTRWRPTPAEIANRQQYVLQLKEALARWDDGRTEDSQSLLDATQDDLRDFDYYYLRRLTDTPLHRVSFGQPVMAIAFSPKAPLLAIATFWADESAGSRPHQEAFADLNFWSLSEASSLAFSPDGKRLAVAGRTVRVLDAESREEIWSLPREKPDLDVFGHVAYSRDGRWLAASELFEKGNQSPDLWVWNASTGDVAKFYKGAGAGDVCFSHDSKLLHVGKKAWSTADWTAAADSDRVTLDTSPDGSRVLYSTDSRMIIETTDAAPETISELPRGAGPWALPPVGEVLAAQGEDDGVRLWLADGTDRERVFRGHKGAVNDIAFDPHGRPWLASAGSDGKVLIWDTRYRQDCVTLENPHICDQVLHQTPFFSANGAYVAVLARASSKLQTQDFSPPLDIAHITLWNVASQTQVGYMQRREECQSIAISESGKYLALLHVAATGARPRDLELTVWDFAAQRQAFPALPYSEDAAPRFVFVRAAGRDLLAVTGNQADNVQIRIVDIATGQPTESLLGFEGRIACLAASQDGTRLAAGGEANRVTSESGHICVWSIPGSLQHQWRHKEAVDWVAFAANLHRLDPPETEEEVRIVFRDKKGGVRICGLADQRQYEIGDLGREATPDSPLAISPSGFRFARVIRGTIRLADLVTGEDVLALPANAESLAFSPDGSILASASSSEIRLWYTKLPRSEAAGR